MMTLIGYFETAAAAYTAKDELQRLGVVPGALHLAVEEPSGATAATGAAAEADAVAAGAQPQRQPSGFRQFFSEVFGADDEDDVGRYADAVRRGGALVAVEFGDAKGVDEVRAALLAAGAVDIDERVEPWRDADDAGDPPGAAPAGSFGDHEPDYRSDFATRYGASGDSYDDFAPAYRFGHDLSTDTRYEGRDWSAIETDVERDWSERYPESAWERFKTAIRHGWEKMTGDRW